MQYEITIIVEGGSELKNDLEKGHIEVAMKQDVFPDEEVQEFQFKEIS